MRKIRFFYRHQLVLLGVLVWTISLNQAVEIQMNEKKEYLKLVEADSRKRDISAKKKNSTGKQNTENSEAKKRPISSETADESEVTEKSIRVLLMTTDYQSYFHPSVTVIRDGKRMSYDASSMEISGDGITIPAHENGIQLTSVQRQCGAPIYQGTLEINREAEGLTVINEVPLETYLEAVVPSEMPSSYEKEAIKAQAVCARTYAWKQMREGRLEHYGADVDDSVNYQVYHNISPQKSTTEAVYETEGQILCQGGEPVQAYYFSTSSGATSTDEIWGAKEAAPYLKSVVCEFDSEEPWSRWKTEIPWKTLETRAGEYLGKKGTLLDISVTGKNESGAVTGLQIVTEEDSFTLQEEYEIRQFLSPSGCKITEKNGTEIEGGSLLPSAYFTLEAVPGVSVSLVGGGYGHGVGMSQNGANEMAKEGYTCEEILDYFFREVELERIS